MTINELRKELKAIGFKVKLERMSFGRVATFTNLDGKSLPSIFFSLEDREPWQPLIDYRINNDSRLKELREADLIGGLLIR